MKRVPILFNYYLQLFVVFNNLNYRFASPLNTLLNSHNVELMRPLSICARLIHVYLVNISSVDSGDGGISADSGRAPKSVIMASLSLELNSEKEPSVSVVLSISL